MRGFKKPQAGVTLVELIVAMAILMVGVAGLFTAFSAGFRTSVQAHDLTMASIEAQLQMESLVGRFWVDDLDDPEFGEDDVDWGEAFESNGFWIVKDFEPYRGSQGHSPLGANNGVDATTDCRHGNFDAVEGDCPGACDEEHLLSINVTVLVGMDEDVDGDNFVLRHSNIINVHGGIF